MNLIIFTLNFVYFFIFFFVSFFFLVLSVETLKNSTTSSFFVKLSIYLPLLFDSFFEIISPVASLLPKETHFFDGLFLEQKKKKNYKMKSLSNKQISTRQRYDENDSKEKEKSPSFCFPFLFLLKDACMCVCVCVHGRVCVQQNNKFVFKTFSRQTAANNYSSNRINW